MGEAARRRRTGETELWFHGTDEHFADWAAPPITARYKPELPPHSFISLSKDRILAEQAGELTKGLCCCRLIDETNVIDFRNDSQESRKCWEKVRISDIGREHPYIQTFRQWMEACTTGEVLRPHTTNPIVGLERQRLIQISRDPRIPQSVRQQAHTEAQVYQRAWIEIVVSSASELDVDAVICAEVDRDRPGGKRAATNLHVFNPLAITSPEWLVVPTHEQANKRIQQLKSAGRWPH